jgi:ribonuclease T2
VQKYFAVIATIVCLALVGSAHAQVKMQGSFEAAQACPALASIKKGSNPGNVSVEVGKAYRLLGKNKEQATHYWIEVPGASPAQRWVVIACGAVDGSAQLAPSPSSGAAVNTPGGTVKPKPKPQGSKDGVPFYVLALSWEPAFCEAMKSKPECKTMKPTDAAATRFSLHGLWPQPRRNVFCNVDAVVAALDDQHQWDKLPAPALSAETRAALSKVMPGTQSLLERHEWIKHGTCYPGGTAESFFKEQVRLAAAVNVSAVGAFMSTNIGKAIQTSDLRKKFDEAFGAGAGERVRVTCDKQGRIGEITIGLKGDIPAGTDIAELIAASEPTDAGCPGGVVDAVN